MKLTKEHLRKIILEEYRNAMGEAETAQPEPEAAQGGDEEAAPGGDEEAGGKDVGKIADKLTKYLTPAMKLINTQDEFKGALTTFLKMASAHPSLGAGKVRLVLMGLAKQVMADANAEKG